MKTLLDLYTQCKAGDAKAQRILYDLFKGRLMGLCRRYTRNREEAQDVLQEAFIKIFSNVDQLDAPEKLESWMKAIVVRTAISAFHATKNKMLLFSTSERAEEQEDFQSLESVSDAYLISLVNALPDGCRIVFNLFAIEGYSHAEIANMLSISEGTSRSQLHHAKYLLKEKLKCQNLAHYYEKFA
ncbi:MAG: sigma-70 family RNA polymerase sigma factor [Cyclobacteriaceae bacterium]|nr:sigma-70 family RNA polymerase sigma factor [Cyclobacteriaceae bacterium]